MAMDTNPPSFQESSRCSVCNAAFSTFRRRHHCRCCGKSLCSEHSSNQMVLPQFGIKSPVRVCDVCFQASTQIANVRKTPDDSGCAVSEAVDSLAKMEVSTTTNDDPTIAEKTLSISVDAQPHQCNCGMPLCICEIPNPSPPAEVITNMQVMAPVLSKQSHRVTSGTGSAPKRPQKSSYGNELPSLFFSSTNMVKDVSDISIKKYDATGEGVWEAIKNGDTKAVEYLLSNGVDPNYQDKQGMSLLHLAAVFNLTEIVLLLMDAGAKVDLKNAQGETPLDCAPATLQYKMQQKIKSTKYDMPGKGAI